MRKLLKHWFFTRVIKNYPKQFMSGGTNVVQDTSYLRPHLSFLPQSDMSATGRESNVSISKLMMGILYSVVTVRKLFMIAIT